ncbi:MAG: hypothetical protein GEU74_07870 [Nitriliruptorales bacterium]|nr:hypothetical protein [Nitriliruptorales bacterium]
MTAEVLAEHSHDISELILVPSSGGVFEVDVDGERVYSKTSVGRHAEPGEILSAIAGRLS